MGADRAKGAAQIQELLAFYPEDPRLHYAAGALLAAERKYEAAMAAMTRSLEIAPHFSQARFQLGLLAIRAGDCARARSALAPLLDLSLDEPLRHLAEGLDHLLAHRLDEAVECLRFGMIVNWSKRGPDREILSLLEDIDLMRRSDREDGEPAGRASKTASSPRRNVH
ncbi:tetratricopeptide repeat protein [Caulobacter mirabilis]|uniref:tetratricopeptide repeat protein n=1 Tax=Caulobacter mirabilis TaxID=69666 RepID=UPI0015599ADA|nr:tetratricopeptide repeat protein [Caulobacter mirabilis]